MADSDELLAQIRSWEQNYEDAKRDNDQLDAKIETLKEARSYLRSAKSAAKTLKSSVKGYEAADTWRGKKRSKLDSELEGHLANEVGNLVADIESAEDEVSSAIWRFETDKNWFVELMSTAEDAIDDIRTKIEELVD